MKSSFILDDLNNKDFFENFETYIPTDELQLIVKNELYKRKKKSILMKNGIYTTCRFNNVNIPDHGWKIHISSNLENSKEVLKKTACYLCKNEITFKFISDSNLLNLSLSKSFPRASSGKFITIYPMNICQFKNILSDLYIILQNYKGPYILSDKRYLDSRVLYYRYGGFKYHGEINEYGDLVTYYRNDIGEKVIDKRLPYFVMPTNVSNPIENEKSENKNEYSYLREMYSINESIRFTNNGGVYRGIRKTDNLRVILKEARPFISIDNQGKDITSVRIEEYNTLKKLQKYEFVPKAIDIFYEWENLFLVEEEIDAITLRDYMMKKCPLAYPNCNSILLKSYLSKIKNIMVSIGKIIEKLKNENLWLTDLSTENIMITDKEEIYIIDLEGIYDINNIPNTIVKNYANGSESENIVNISLFNIIVNLFAERANLTRLNANANKKMISYILNEYGIESNLNQIIENLFDKNYSVDIFVRDMENCYFIEKQETKKKNTYMKLYNNLIITQKLYDEYLRNNIIQFIPNTPYIDTKYNFSYGVFGFHYSCYMQFDENKTIKHERCKINEIGLLIGECGELWHCICTNQKKKSKKLIEKLRFDSRFQNNYSLGYGVTGYGICLLKYYSKFKEHDILDNIISLADLLVDKLISIDLDITFSKYGITNGTSGISLFLLYVYYITKNEKYIYASKTLLMYELKRTVKGEQDILYLPYSDDDLRLSPYWAIGNAGIISVMVRYLYIINDDEIKEYLIQMLPSLNVQFTINCGLFNGIVGIANTLLDCYHFLHKKEYLKKAESIANSIETFVCYKENILYLPGDYLMKYSLDYGTGIAGVSLFLNRIISNEKCNFNFYVDELLFN